MQREQVLQEAMELLRELEARSAAYRSGKMPARPAEEVLADSRKRQADEAQA